MQENATGGKGAKMADVIKVYAGIIVRMREWLTQNGSGKKSRRSHTLNRKGQESRTKKNKEKSRQLTSLQDILPVLTDAWGVNGLPDTDTSSIDESHISTPNQWRDHNPLLNKRSKEGPLPNQNRGNVPPIQHRREDISLANLRSDVSSHTIHQRDDSFSPPRRNSDGIPTEQQCLRQTSIRPWRDIDNHFGHRKGISAPTTQRLHECPQPPQKLRQIRPWRNPPTHPIHQRGDSAPTLRKRGGSSNPTIMRQGDPVLQFQQRGDSEPQFQRRVLEATPIVRHEVEISPIEPWRRPNIPSVHSLNASLPPDQKPVQDNPCSINSDVTTSVQSSKEDTSEIQRRREATPSILHKQKDLFQQNRESDPSTEKQDIHKLLGQLRVGGAAPSINLRDVAKPPLAIRRETIAMQMSTPHDGDSDSGDSGRSSVKGAVSQESTSGQVPSLPLSPRASPASEKDHNFCTIRLQDSGKCTIQKGPVTFCDQRTRARNSLYPSYPPQQSSCIKQEAESLKRQTAFNRYSNQRKSEETSEASGDRSRNGRRGKEIDYEHWCRTEIVNMMVDEIYNLQAVGSRVEPFIPTRDGVRKRTTDEVKPANFDDKKSDTQECHKNLAKAKLLDEGTSDSSWLLLSEHSVGESSFPSASSKHKIEIPKKRLPPEQEKENRVAKDTPVSKTSDVVPQGSEDTSQHTSRLSKNRLNPSPFVEQESIDTSTNMRPGGTSGDGDGKGLPVGRGQGVLSSDVLAGRRTLVKDLRVPFSNDFTKTNGSSPSPNRGGSSSTGDYNFTTAPRTLIRNFLQKNNHSFKKWHGKATHTEDNNECRNAHPDIPNKAADKTTRALDNGIKKTPSKSLDFFLADKGSIDSFSTSSSTSYSYKQYRQRKVISDDISRKSQRSSENGCFNEKRSDNIKRIHDERDVKMKNGKWWFQDDSDDMFSSLSEDETKSSDTAKSKSLQHTSKNNEKSSIRRNISDESLCNVILEDVVKKGNVKLTDFFSVVAQELSKQSRPPTGSANQRSRRDISNTSSNSLFKLMAERGDSSSSSKMSLDSTHKKSLSERNDSAREKILRLLLRELNDEEKSNIADPRETQNVVQEGRIQRREGNATPSIPSDNSIRQGDASTASMDSTGNEKPTNPTQTVRRRMSLPKDTQLRTMPSNVIEGGDYADASDNKRNRTITDNINSSLASLESKWKVMLKTVIQGGPPASRGFPSSEVLQRNTNYSRRLMRRETERDNVHPRVHRSEDTDDVQDSKSLAGLRSSIALRHWNEKKGEAVSSSTIFSSRNLPQETRMLQNIDENPNDTLTLKRKDSKRDSGIDDNTTTNESTLSRNETKDQETTSKSHVTPLDSLLQLDNMEVERQPVRVLIVNDCPEAGDSGQALQRIKLVDKMKWRGTEMEERIRAWRTMTNDNPKEADGSRTDGKEKMKPHVSTNVLYTNMRDSEKENSSSGNSSEEGPGSSETLVPSSESIRTNSMVEIKDDVTRPPNFAVIMEETEDSKSSDPTSTDVSVIHNTIPNDSVSSPQDVSNENECKEVKSETTLKDCSIYACGDTPSNAGHPSSDSDDSGVTILPKDGDVFSFGDDVKKPRVTVSYSLITPRTGGVGYSLLPLNKRGVSYPEMKSRIKQPHPGVSYSVVHKTEEGITKSEPPREGDGDAPSELKYPREGQQPFPNETTRVRNSSKTDIIQPVDEGNKQVLIVAPDANLKRDNPYTTRDSHDMFRETMTPDSSVMTGHDEVGDPPEIESKACDHTSVEDDCTVIEMSRKDDPNPPLNVRGKLFSSPSERTEISNVAGKAEETILSDEVDIPYPECESEGSTQPRKPKRKRFDEYVGAKRHEEVEQPTCSGCDSLNTELESEEDDVLALAVADAASGIVVASTTDGWGMTSEAGVLSLFTNVSNDMSTCGDGTGSDGSVGGVVPRRQRRRPLRGAGSAGALEAATRHLLDSALSAAAAAEVVRLELRRRNSARNRRALRGWIATLKWLRAIASASGGGSVHSGGGGGGGENPSVRHTCSDGRRSFCSANHRKRIEENEAKNRGIEDNGKKDRGHDEEKMDEGKEYPEDEEYCVPCVACGACARCGGCMVCGALRHQVT